jgi:hypothetical protein
MLTKSAQIMAGKNCARKIGGKYDGRTCAETQSVQFFTSAPLISFAIGSHGDQMSL